MKLMLLALLVCFACSTEPKTPAACQKNLQYCLSTQKDHPAHPASEWNQLCLEDLQECKSNWGMQ